MADTRDEGRMARFPKGVSEMAKQRRYDKEFKLAAARLVVEQGYTQTEAAERLGVSAWSIGRWIEKYRATGTLRLLEAVGWPAVDAAASLSPRGQRSPPLA